MKQNHVAGDKIFVDYSGMTFDIIDAATNEIRAAQIFIAILGASNYTYAEASWTQQLEDFFFFFFFWSAAGPPVLGTDAD